MPHLSVVFVEDVLDVFVVAFDPGGTLRSRVGLSSHGRPPVAEHGVITAGYCGGCTKTAAPDRSLQLCP